ncbi:hypothetical protein PSP20601_00240 [Pandoraea sputorum]|uniref:Uncharacterized protein n=1 Tax=Pandoraea sputorum TaxID=93222 RepID=A0A239S969_9BURK|nr:Uncharacterised protein [Pandoraea sputorum]VVD63904.1 hypothetical protein PSP20601_00240 [Pandoraea sputorum]
MVSPGGKVLHTLASTMRELAKRLQDIDFIWHVSGRRSNHSGEAD